MNAQGPARRDAAWPAVGFDLDGTLFDHRGSAEVAIAQFVDELGGIRIADLTEAWFDLEGEHFEAWRQERISFGEQRRRRLRSFLPLLGIRSLDDDETLDALFGRYLRAYRAAWRPFDDAMPLLAQLQAQGTRVGVLTNGNHAQQVDKLHSVGLMPFIDVVCTSEELGVAKPNRRAFEELAARLGMPVGSVVFIGDDRAHDVDGARSAGMAAGLVDRTLSRPITLEDALRTATGP